MASIATNKTRAMRRQERVAETVASALPTGAVVMVDVTEMAEKAEITVDFMVNISLKQLQFDTK